MNNTLNNEITGKQLVFLSKLLDEAVELLDVRDKITGCEWPEARQGVAHMRSMADQMTKREASAAIGAAMDNNDKLREELKDIGVEPAPQRPVETPVTEFVTTGMYQVNDRIFKVLPSRASERHYAKELVGESQTGFGFEYARGAMRMIRPEHRMTAAQAAEFGKLTGSCCCCGRLLTDPNSIADGIGPVCKDKHFS